MAINVPSSKNSPQRSALKEARSFVEQIEPEDMTYRDLGEDVEYQGQYRQVYPNPFASESFFHVLLWKCGRYAHCL